MYVLMRIFVYLYIINFFTGFKVNRTHTHTHTHTHTITRKKSHSSITYITKTTAHSKIFVCKIQHGDLSAVEIHKFSRVTLNRLYAINLLRPTACKHPWDCV